LEEFINKCLTKKYKAIIINSLLMGKYMNKKEPITIISLFSGCGGMDLGFLGGFEFLGKKYKKNQFEIIWANEINTVACNTYRKNIGNHIIEGDIQQKINMLPQYADVIIGGFPCQDISINGKMKGVKGKRSCLYTSIVEAVKKIQPKIFIAENVKGLLLKSNADSLQKILDDFNSLGYNITYKLYDAASFGVPQTRERVFIVGTRNDVSSFVHPMPVCKEFITVKEAIGDLEKLTENDTFNHIWSKANKSTEQGNRKLLANRPGYTIRAECHGNIQFHYTLPRRISMREAARIQSFPDSFLFQAKLRETERQIGNAVPPVLAWHIANAAQKTIMENKQ
jgi:DNA (cytosine-5)-methyltransferase 1